MKIDGKRPRGWPPPSSWGEATAAAGVWGQGSSVPLPLRALSGNVLGLWGCHLSCGVSSVMWRSSRESRGRVTPPEPPCWVQGFSWLRAWRGLCSAPRPEAVELWRWLIKAGCLGRPICSQVNCAAIFPFGRRTKTSRQFVQRMDGRSHVPVRIPPLAFPEPQRPTRSHAECAMCWYKRRGNTLPAAACWTPAKHPLLLLRFWQLCVLCLLWCLLRRQLCGHRLAITLSPICRRSLLILRLVLHWRGNVMVCECYSERCASQVFTHSSSLPQERCAWLISLHPGVQRATLSNILEPRRWGTIEAGEQLAPNLWRLPAAFTVASLTGWGHWRRS